MTFRVFMQAHIIHLSNAFEALNSIDDANELVHNVRKGTVVVFSCVAALEAISNLASRRLGIKWGARKISVADKIKTLYSAKWVDFIKSVDVKAFAELIRARNWNTHFKEDEIGLIWSCWWVDNEANKAPRIDLLEVFSKEKCQEFYTCARHVLLELARMLGESEELLKSIESDDFEDHCFIVW